MNAFRWTLAAAALSLLVAPANAALCVKRSGAVVARAACKQKETVLSADVFSGSPGPAGAAGAKGDKGDTFNSYEYPTPTCATGLTPRGFCCENLSSPDTEDAGPVQTLNLSSLGAPPFSVVK